MGGAEEVEIAEDDDVVRSVEALVIEEIGDTPEVDGAAEEVVGLEAAFEVEADDHGVILSAGDIDDGGGVGAGEVLGAGGRVDAVGAGEGEL